MKRKIGVALLAGLLFVTQTSSIIYGADAGNQMQEYIGEGKIPLGKGDSIIKIQGNSGQSLLGKKFRLYKLFHAENSVGGESINYSFHEEYKKAVQSVVARKLGKQAVDVTEYEAIDYIQSMNTNLVEGAQTPQSLEGRYSELRYFIEELRTEMVTLGCAAEEVVVSSVTATNEVHFTGLDYGYYIVDEVSDNEGTHSASSLCMVNTANPSASIHIKSDYPRVEKKIQEDDHKNEIGNDGWNDIGDYEIGQLVPYRFTSKIPDMSGYDRYYFAWHDALAPELTFDKSTLRIVVSDGKKSYQVRPGEYHLIVSDPDLTFKAEIPNLKGIIDREFGPNTCGQIITLYYGAYLNERAAENTGRPGFENDVRLEFSNDPDAAGQGKTGFTPWDTVVCFTYRLNIKKTNNHNLPLEHAQFRLYYDSECTKEVYVQQIGEEYVVIGRDMCGDKPPKHAVLMKSKADGEIVIKGLDQGTFYLKEVEAPDGYRKILDPIILHVNPTFSTDRNSYIKGAGATDQILQNLKITADIRHFLEGKYTEARNELKTNLEEGSGNLVVVNHVGSKLPTTGSKMTIVLLVAGVGFIMTAGLISVKKKDRMNER